MKVMLRCIDSVKGGIKKKRRKLPKFCTLHTVCVANTFCVEIMSGMLEAIKLTQQFTCPQNLQ